MISLYSPKEARRLGAWAKISLILAWVLLAAALTICVVLCTRVRTGNAEQMYISVVGLFTLAGWAAILLLLLAHLPCKAENRHMTGILAGQPEAFQGRLTLQPGAFQIPKSILIRKAALTDGEETVTLNLNARFAGRLPKNGSFVKVLAVRRYITAVEVLHENA